MPLLTKKTIRTKLDVSLDIPTTLDLKIWKGNATDFEIGVFEGADVISLADVTSVNMKVQPSQADDTTLMDSTVASTEIDDTLTTSTWDDGTQQHATFSFTNAQTNLAISCVKSTFWGVFTAILTGGEEVTLGAGSFEVHEDNNETAGDPDVNPGTPITIEEADARYQDILAEGKFVDGDKTKLDLQSGTNTGDQDLSTYQLEPAEGAFVDGDKTKLDLCPTSDPAAVTGADAITNMMSLTQAEYDAIATPDATTLYVIPA